MGLGQRHCAQSTAAGLRSAKNIAILSPNHPRTAPKSAVIISTKSRLLHTTQFCLPPTKLQTICCLKYSRFWATRLSSEDQKCQKLLKLFFTFLVMRRWLRVAGRNSPHRSQSDKVTSVVLSGPERLTDVKHSAPNNGCRHMMQFSNGLTRTRYFRHDKQQVTL